MNPRPLICLVDISARRTSRRLQGACGRRAAARVPGRRSRLETMACAWGSPSCPRGRARSSAASASTPAPSRGSSRSRQGAKRGRPRDHRGALRRRMVGRIRVGRQVRRVVHSRSLPAGSPRPTTPTSPMTSRSWGSNAPVTRVRPVPLAAPGVRLPRRVRLLGRGRTAATAAVSRANSVRRGWRSVGDSACARVWRRHPRHPECFSAARTPNAIDADGRPPLSSGCHGDSGGPPPKNNRRPRLLGPKAGAAPVAAPITCRACPPRLPATHVRARAQTSLGTAADQPGPHSRRHARRPDAPHLHPARVRRSPWTRSRSMGADRDFAVVATGPSYTVQPRDSGCAISCQVTATIPVGPTTTMWNAHDRALTPTAGLRRPRLSDVHASMGYFPCQVLD